MEPKWRFSVSLLTSCCVCAEKIVTLHAQSALCVHHSDKTQNASSSNTNIRLKPQQYGNIRTTLSEPTLYTQIHFSTCREGENRLYPPLCTDVPRRQTPQSVGVLCPHARAGTAATGSLQNLRKRDVQYRYGRHRGGSRYFYFRYLAKRRSHRCARHLARRCRCGIGRLLVPSLSARRRRRVGALPCRYPREPDGALRHLPRV